ALDFDGPQLPSGQGKDEIDFGPSRGTIETSFGALRGGGNQRFDHEALPALAHDWMSKQQLLVCEAEKRMRQAAVAHVDLGDFTSRLASLRVHAGKRGTRRRSSNK